MGSCTRTSRCAIRERFAQLELDAAQTHLPDNVALALEAPAELPAVVADPGQLRQVLSNLIENAVKYSPDGGTVRVALAPDDRHVRFRSATPGSASADRAAADLREVLPARSRHDPRHRRHRLGLYICRELVRRVDGRIWVESDGRTGSTFHVEIPQEAVPAPPSGSRRKIAA